MDPRPFIWTTKRLIFYLHDKPNLKKRKQNESTGRGGLRKKKKKVLVGYQKHVRLVQPKFQMSIVDERLRLESLGLHIKILSLKALSILSLSQFILYLLNLIGYKLSHEA